MANKKNVQEKKSETVSQDELDFLVGCSRPNIQYSKEMSFGELISKTSGEVQETDKGSILVYSVNGMEMSILLLGDFGDEDKVKIAKNLPSKKGGLFNAIVEA